MAIPFFRYSCTDAVSFAILSRRKINKEFRFERRFAIAGFIRIL
jgi:hypothetical protein